MHTYPSKRSWWSSESMPAALNEVKSGVLSLQKARRKYNVPIKKKVQCADIYIARSCYWQDKRIKN